LEAVVRHLALLSAVVALAGLCPVVAAAAPPIPAFGTAVVDGQYAEWDLTADFFANMYMGGKINKPIESKLYLRYDCQPMTMYALVLCEPGVVGYIFYDSTSVDTSNAWIKIVGETGNVVDEYDGNDGIPPDFAYVGQGYDGDPLHIQGYEASFPIEPATYNIIAHIEVWYADSLATSATGGFPHTGPELQIECTPTGVEPTTFGAIKALYR
jgi:hypothetical protein